MRVDALGQKPDRAGRVMLKCSDGSVLRVYPQVVQDFGLHPGIELTDGEWEKLLAAAGSVSAKMRAVRIVSASAVSRKNLEQRLRQKGETPEHAQEAVEWMAGLNLLDDRETARQIVARGAARGYGKARIRQMLYEKGIPRDLWEEALENLEDPDEAIMQYLRRYLPRNPDPKQKKKVIDALVRRGHGWQDIQRCLRQYGQDLEEYPEDLDG